MLKNTLTTRAFNGIPKRFMMTDLWESGTYLLLRVPIEGKYIPTHPSNAKNAVTNAARGIPTTEPVVDIHAAIPMEIVATVNIALVNFSVGTFFFTNWPKIVDPKRQLAMKQENTVP